MQEKFLAVLLLRFKGHPRNAKTGLVRSVVKPGRAIKSWVSINRWYGSDVLESYSLSASSITDFLVLSCTLKLSSIRVPVVVIFRRFEQDGVQCGGGAIRSRFGHRGAVVGIHCLMSDNVSRV